VIATIPRPDWQPVDSELADLFWATLTCPLCRNLCSIGRGRHTIAADGTVQPSMVCPHHGCTFHEFIRLDGWEAP
jgi:hypothetical protein